MKSLGIPRPSARFGSRPASEKGKKPPRNVRIYFNCSVLTQDFQIVCCLVCLVDSRGEPGEENDQVLHHHG